MSRRPPIPGPLRRLAREPGRIAALGLLALVALASAGLQAGAVVALRASLDANWRGAYDILVTSGDAAGDREGLLPPNALGGEGPGMTLAEVETIRRVNGVDVAAPIGEILVPALAFADARVAIPRELAGADEAPQAFRVTAEFTTDDGLGERAVTIGTHTIVVDGSRGEPAPDPACTPTDGSFNNFAYTAEEYPALASWHCFTDYGDGVYEEFSDGGMSFQDPLDDATFQYSLMSSSPGSTTRITLIDPESERALLGEAGSFLTPLLDLAPGADTRVDDMTRWAQSEPGPFGRAYLAEQEDIALQMAGIGVYRSEAVIDDLRRLHAANGSDWDEIGRAALADGRYLPLLVADAAVAPLTVKVTVETFGAVENLPPENVPFGGPSFRYTLPESLREGLPGDVVGTTVADISDALNPFRRAAAGIAWPGADPSTAELLPDYSSLGVPSLARPTASPLALVGDTALLRAAGYRAPRLFESGPESAFDLAADPTTPGTETAYTGLRRLPTPQGVSAVPIGTFPATGVTSADDAVDFVPLGAYEPVGSRIAEGPHAGAELAPSVTGLGLVSPRTIAIGSLTSVASWGDGAHVNAIRVRVDGIDGYSAAAQERVVEVAAAIEALGYQAAVVAGSSPVDTPVRVLDYAFGAPAGGLQATGELGTILQRWSELGAAARAELALEGASIAALAVALGAGVILLGAVQLAGVPARRTQSGVLRQLGFPRSRIAVWLAAEELPALLGFVLVAALAIWLSSASRLSLLVIGIAGGTAVLASILVVALGSRSANARRITPPASARLGARTVAGFGARQALVHPLGTLLHITAVVLVGVASGALAATVLRGRAESGQSLLAGLLAEQQLLPQLALGASGVTAGIVLALLVRRLELRRRRHQWAALRAAGWTTRQLSLAQRVEGALVVGPALLIAGALVAAGTIWLVPAATPWITTLLALAGTGLASIVTLSTRVEGARS